jgi:hypothetical protein
MVTTRATSQVPATTIPATQYLAAQGSTVQSSATLASAHDDDDNQSEFTDIGEIERQLGAAAGPSDAPPSGQPQPQPQTESPTPTVSQQLAELMQAVQGMAAPPVTPQPAGNTALLSALVQAVTALASNPDLTAASRIGAPVAPTAGEDPRILPIRSRFPAVDPTLLVEILENRFKVENLLKLNASFIYTPERKHENIYLGGLEIPTARSTITLEEYHNLSWLMEPFEIYCQVLVEFTPEQNKIALAAALGDYRRRLYELNRRCSWDSIRHFHFSFHRKRVFTGVSDPAGWREDEPALAQLLQARQSQANPGPRGVKRPAPYDSEGAASYARRNGPRQPDVVVLDACRRHNRNGCNSGGNCPWRHVCYVCGAANHIASSCSSPGTGKPSGNLRGTQHGGRPLATGGNSA